MKKLNANEMRNVEGGWYNYKYVDYCPKCRMTQYTDSWSMHASFQVYHGFHGVYRLAS